MKSRFFFMFVFCFLSICLFLFLFVFKCMAEVLTLELKVYDSLSQEEMASLAHCNGKNS